MAKDSETLVELVSLSGLVGNPLHQSATWRITPEKSTNSLRFLGYFLVAKRAFLGLETPF